MGRRNFARVFTLDLKGHRPFRHYLRMMNLKINRSSYYTVKNQRSMREEGTTAWFIIYECKHSLTSSYKTLPLLLSGYFRRISCTEFLSPSRSQSSDSSLSFYSSSIVPGCTGSQQTEDTFPRLYKLRLASNRHRQSTLYGKFRMDLVLRWILTFQYTFPLIPSAVDSQNNRVISNASYSLSPPCCKQTEACPLVHNVTWCDVTLEMGLYSKHGPLRFTCYNLHFKGEDLINLAQFPP